LRQCKVLESSSPDAKLLIKPAAKNRAPTYIAYTMLAFESSAGLPVQVYKFNVPTFGKDVVFDVSHKVRAEQFKMFSEALKIAKMTDYVPLFVKEPAGPLWPDSWRGGVSATLQHGVDIFKVSVVSTKCQR